MASTEFTHVGRPQLEEYASLEFILLGDLRDLLEEPSDELTCKWLRAVLDALLDTLPRKFRLQEEGGYLSEVLEQYPNWYSQVDELHRQQRQLYAKLSRLRGRIAEEVSYEEIADSISDDLRAWMQSLLAYHRHERRMLQTAFNLEVGGGD
mgnify:CR=1 FL=1